MHEIPAFSVIGIRVRTTNENGQAANDIGALWGRFMSENIADNIPNRVDNDVLSVYCNYEGDYMQPYDNIIGCRVSSLDSIPDGMVGHVVEGGKFRQFTAVGDLMQGAVAKTWVVIWQTDLARTYLSDFEVYGIEAQDPQNAEVDIFVAISD